MKEGEKMAEKEAERERAGENEEKGVVGDGGVKKIGVKGRRGKRKERVGKEGW